MPETNGSCHCGPGYDTPLAAMEYGPREKILYTVCIQPDLTKPDYLATIDVDPSSPNYSNVIHRLKMPYVKDELHHFGWNTCSSCHGDSSKKRDKLVLPALGSDRIYIIDVANPKAPTIFKVLEPEAMQSLGVGTPHTTHCLPSGEVMISTMGNYPQGDGLGEFVLIDNSSWQVTGLWTNGEQAKFGYDFWYQPYWDIMVSSEWGAPKSFKKGCIPEENMDPKLTGRSLNFYSWKDRKLLQTINLGLDGVAPLEIRFLHDPKASEGFVGCALNANIFRFYRKSDGAWSADKVIDIPAKKLDGENNPEIQGMISDILISLDDRFLYFSCWLHGDVRQYDISDTSNPKLTAQVFLGGKIYKDGPLKVVHDTELKEQPEALYLKEKRIHGGPQMLQLSLDGKRLYVTTSLYSPWDKQIYPELAKNGSVMMKLDIDPVNGGMVLDKDFLVDFGNEPDGPVLAHETRYPGGDCTSEIWLAK
ncbi:methanethiol oxidase isoform X2 [Nilaparvata lugens]|uniref:methanethiol oxidase isoform X1 n=1 Tax=Nilaparvata lugens TaxID=108931 RepID=UPI000B985581|nr:methanethiol oxidase isoform X1 [Nilaparvata lugens]XP_039284377.1 methanethiol oxidase isoform X2 [Nilaparvata lugens]